MGLDRATIHATAVVVGEAGILIRGPSGAGKTRLALQVLEEGRRRGGFARLVGDDRVVIRQSGGRVIASVHPAIAGLVERRTQPFGHMDYEEACVIRLVVDIHPPGAPLPRYPDEATPKRVGIAGVADLPLLSLQGPPDALSCRLVMEALGTD